MNKFAGCLFILAKLAGFGVVAGTFTGHRQFAIGCIIAGAFFLISCISICLWVMYGGYYDDIDAP